VPAALVTVTVAVAGVEVVSSRSRRCWSRWTRRGIAADGDRRADELQRRGCLARLLHADKALQIGVHVDLLLDRSKLDQLLRKLIGIERIERILVLQLRGEIGVGNHQLRVAAGRGARLRRSRGRTIARRCRNCIGLRCADVVRVEALALRRRVG